MSSSSEAINEAAENFGKAAYHGGYFVIARIHVLLTECNDHSKVGEFLNWKRTLDTIYREIDWKLNPSEREQRVIKLRELLPKIRFYVQTNGGKASGAAKALAADEAYTLLADYEVFLRRLMGKYGLVMPDKEVFDPTKGI